MEFRDIIVIMHMLSWMYSIQLNEIFSPDILSGVLSKIEFSSK